jgi:hypothetical protein
MPTTAEHFMICIFINIIAHIAFDLIYQEEGGIFRSVSKEGPNPVEDPLSDDASDISWSTSSETIVASAETSPITRVSRMATPPLPQTPVLPPAVPLPVDQDMPVPNEHHLDLLSHVEFLEQDNLYAHEELQRVSNAERQWRGTVHAFSTQIEQLEHERELQRARHKHWRAVAAERAQKGAHLSARALHLEERVTGLEFDVVCLMGMNDTLADMMVQARNHHQGDTARLEGKVADLESDNDLLLDEVQRLRGEARVHQEEAERELQADSSEWQNVPLPSGSRTMPQ